MNTSTIIAIYFLIWWVTLFAVLPWGVRSQEEGGNVAPGTDPGAPTIHRIWIKFAWTTVIASIVFGILFALYTYNLIPYDFLMRISTPPHQ